MQSRRIVIGITGGIGSGKSSVSRYLSGLGENIICADEVSRIIVRPGEKGNTAIREAFGDEFFDNNELDRRKLAGLVFSNEKKLDLLNSIMHPLIVDYIFDKVEHLDNRQKRIFHNAVA